MMRNDIPKTEKAKSVRCVIYTRVSTDQRLEQDFNSLDAQYEAAQAYIRSQAHANWTLIKAKYDDGGFSGGTTDRPALQRLLKDVRDDKIDIVVVYKVDRLTRSLADFAKLVELFDQHNVCFVSVTQQFNTTSSMGRLTLNVLLSFAQFEREVTSERIRDKIAASKRKGLWVGGMVPLGYTVRNKQVFVQIDEAKRVRKIFESYLECDSLADATTLLKRLKIVSKVRKLKSGKRAGGINFIRSSLSHLLRNRFYIGEVIYKGETLPGPQPPIVPRKLFDAVQAKLNSQLQSLVRTRSRSEALLVGKIFDDRGNRMSPGHTRKNGIKYRYYISSPLIDGQADKSGSINRVPAHDVETSVTNAIRKRLDIDRATSDRDLLTTVLTRVDVQKGYLFIFGEQRRRGAKTSKVTIRIPWQKPPTRYARELIPPIDGTLRDRGPIRIENRKLLIKAIARGRRWLDEILTSPATSQETIARRERCTIRKVNMTISLAFLAPGLVKAAIEGALPYGLGATRLYDMPADWFQQYKKLGLKPPAPLNI